MVYYCSAVGVSDLEKMYLSVWGLLDLLQKVPVCVLALFEVLCWLNRVRNCLVA